MRSVFRVIHDSHDEVKQYIDGRYFCALEELHLPHEQRIVFDPSSDAMDIVDGAENAETALTRFSSAFRPQT